MIYSEEIFVGIILLRQIFVKRHNDENILSC